MLALSCIISSFFCSNDQALCQAQDRERALNREALQQPPPLQAQNQLGCEPEEQVSEDYEQIYDEIWLLVKQHFLYRERLRHWSSWRHRFDGALTDKDKANDAIRRMLDSLQDDYTFFRDQSATLERKNLSEKSKVVEYRMLNNTIGYIHIDTFNSNLSPGETRQALTMLSQARGLILDLRDNWGGSIANAFDVFALFARTGKFVTMRGTEEEADLCEEMVLENDRCLTITNGNTAISNRLANLTGNKPLVILVNGYTKSAAEMLAGALRDNGRATIVGSRTYGKGIVQRVWEFPNNTSIKITSARFYLPGGSCIHKIGILPDMPDSSRSTDEQLARAQAVLTHQLVSLISP